MIDLKFIKIESKSIWKETVKNCNPGHSIDYAMLEQLHTSKETILLTFLIKNKKRNCPFHIEPYKNNKRLFSLRGYSGFDDDLEPKTLNELQISLRERKINSIYFTNNPFIKSKVKAIKGYSKFKNNTYLMDLKKDLKTIKKESHTLIRRNLKKSENIDIVVLINNKSINKDLKNLYNENLERLGLSNTDLFTNKSINYLYGEFDINKKFLHLSFGQKRKMRMLFLLLINKPIWILDDPFNGLDEESINKLTKIMSMKRDQNGMIIIATHIIPELTGIKEYNLI